MKIFIYFSLLFKTVRMKNKITALLFFSISFFSLCLNAQQGKDPALTVTTSTVVNVYTSLAVNATTAVPTLTVASTAGFSAGDLVYIIQMQGASVNAVEEPITGDTTASDPVNPALPF